MASILDLATAYRAEGLHVYEVPGWRNRGHSDGPMLPRGGGWHHTADNSGLISVLNLNGPDIRPDVPQPRANVWVPRDEDYDLAMVCAGTAYHFGAGSRTALALAWNGRVSAATPDAAVAGYPDDLDDTAPGNATMIGHEVENLGTGQPLTARQLWAIPRIAAAECRLFGWGPGHHMHHRQYTRRKPDMQWRGDLWALTAAQLAHTSGGDMALDPDAKAYIDGKFAALATAIGITWYGDDRDDAKDVGTHPYNLQAISKRLDALAAGGGGGGQVDALALATELAKHLQLKAV
jgi:hypothetical protein